MCIIWGKSGVRFENLLFNKQPRWFQSFDYCHSIYESESHSEELNSNLGCTTSYMNLGKDLISLRDSFLLCKMRKWKCLSFRLPWEWNKITCEKLAKCIWQFLAYSKPLYASYVHISMNFFSKFIFKKRCMLHILVYL